jgi:GNAT superfamily N-acetyltransferase
MKLERIFENTKKHYKAAYELYQRSFPKEERRDLDEHEKVMQHRDYRFDVILEEDRLLGIMLFWETENFIFLEHFATLEDVRGNGIGSKALELFKASGKTVILEIEPPTDTLTRRRLGFYQRNGMILNPHHHIQAKYRVNDVDLELKIMSYPKELSEREYAEFYAYMKREVEAK